MILTLLRFRNGKDFILRSTSEVQLSHFHEYRANVRRYYLPLRFAEAHSSIACLLCSVGSHNNQVGQPGR